MTSTTLLVDLCVCMCVCVCACVHVRVRVGGVCVGGRVYRTTKMGARHDLSVAASRLEIVPTSFHGLSDREVVNMTHTRTHTHTHAHAHAQTHAHTHT